MFEISPPEQWAHILDAAIATVFFIAVVDLQVLDARHLCVSDALRAFTRQPARDEDGPLERRRHHLAHVEPAGLDLEHLQLRYALPQLLEVPRVVPADLIGVVAERDLAGGRWRLLAEQVDQILEVIFIGIAVGLEGKLNDETPRGMTQHGVEDVNSPAIKLVVGVAIMAEPDPVDEAVPPEERLLLRLLPLFLLRRCAQMRHAVVASFVVDRLVFGQRPQKIVGVFSEQGLGLPVLVVKLERHQLAARIALLLEPIGEYGVGLSVMRVGRDGRLELRVACVGGEGVRVCRRLAARLDIALLRLLDDELVVLRSGLCGGGKLLGRAPARCADLAVGRGERLSRQRNLPELVRRALTELEMASARLSRRVRLGLALASLRGRRFASFALDEHIALLRLLGDELVLLLLRLGGGGKLLCRASARRADLAVGRGKGVARLHNLPELLRVTL